MHMFRFSFLLWLEISAYCRQATMAREWRTNDNSVITRCAHGGRIGRWKLIRIQKAQIPRVLEAKSYICRGFSSSNIPRQSEKNYCKINKYLIFIICCYTLNLKTWSKNIVIIITGRFVNCKMPIFIVTRIYNLFNAAKRCLSSWFSKSYTK